MRKTLLLAFLATALWAAPKKIPTGQTENEVVRISATLYADKESVKQLLSSDLGGNFIVVDVKIEPRTDKGIKIDRDDFVLKTDRDGERSRPFQPSQIAGRGALVVSRTSGGGGIRGEQGGPVWGGYPGGGGPMRMPGSGGGFGNSGDPGGAEAKVHSGNKEKENPLLKVLEEKILPQKEITDAASGLLYFSLEAKQKVKDLELWYNTSAGKLTLRFK